MQAAVRPALAAAVLIGAGVATQARINGELGGRVGHPVLAGLVSLAVGLLASFLLVSRRPSLADLRGLPVWTLFIGLGGALLIAVSAAAAPVIGVAVLTVGLVAGQTIGGLVVDRAGLGPIGVVPLTPWRIGGVTLCLLAVALIALGVDGPADHPVLVGAAVLAGAVSAVQGAGIATIGTTTGDRHSAVLVNFVGGTLALAAAVAVLAASGRIGAPDWPGVADWWLYAGGLIGVIFVLVAAVVVPLVGVLRFGLAAVAGQLLGAVVLDLVLPTDGGLPGLAWLAAVLTLGAVGISGRGRQGLAVTSRSEQVAR